MNDPIVATVHDAVIESRALVAMIGRDRAEDAADLAASLAIMEACVAEAAIERGRVRRKLLEIARGKAARARYTIEAAVAWRAVTFVDVCDARAAIVLAEDALAAPEPYAIFALRRTQATCTATGRR